MEKKKKDKKVVSANGQEPPSNDFLSEEDENGTKRKSNKTGNTLQDNASVPDQHYSQIQWQQTPTLQPNANNHLVQQVQPTLHLPQSNPPFWMPQQPSYQLAGVNIPGNFPPFSSLPTVDACCQASAMLGGNSSRSQLPFLNLCYPASYPYSGFPGPWDPSPWCAHSQPPQPSYAHHFPGAYGHLSSPPPPMATFGESPARGIIKPKAKLSQKHYELWEAQSAENVRLWSVIAQLQSEIADHKSRLIKLEAEVSSIRPSGIETGTHFTPPTLAGQASKRRRPKRLATSADALASPNRSRPRVRGRKPAASKAQIEPTTLERDEKFSQNKADENSKKKILDASERNGDHVMEVNGGSESTPAFQCQPHQFGTNTTSEVKISGSKVNDSETSKLKGASIMGIANNDAIGWPASVYPEENGKNLCFYDNGRMTVTRGNEWHFVDDQEDASDELEDGAAAKDDNEEGVGDDSSSGTEENIGRRKDVVDACDVDDAVGTGSNTLPQYNNW